jgi:hypothetical protein
MAKAIVTLYSNDPPCPSLAVDGTVIVRDGTVTFEELRAALPGPRG